jgi:voltage-gated potassium channel Kch
VAEAEEGAADCVGLARRLASLEASLSEERSRREAAERSAALLEERLKLLPKTHTSGRVSALEVDEASSPLVHAAISLAALLVVAAAFFTRGGSDDPEDEKTGYHAEAAKVRAAFSRRKNIACTVVLILWFSCGWIIYRWMSYGPAAAFYAMAQIITTVGYGDIIPQTQGQKLATVVIVLSSTLLIANVIMCAVDSLLDGNEEETSKTIIEREERLQEAIKAASNESEKAIRLEELGKIEKEENIAKMLWKLTFDTAFFCFCVAVGTAFFATFEKCSCSYGHTAIEGCVQERCATPGPGETKGTQKTWVDAFYMSIITMSTVGFGDVVAVSWMGRIFASVWMLIGVGAMINFVTSISDFFSSIQDQMMREQLTFALFHEYDDDSSGTLSKQEFMTLQLVSNGLARAAQIESIYKQFEILADGEGEVSMNHFASFYVGSEYNPSADSARA